MTVYRYLPDGTRVEFPSEEAADAAEEQVAGLVKVEDWRSGFDGRHVDLYPSPNPLGSESE